MLGIFICWRRIKKSLFLRESVTYRQTDRRTQANFNIDWDTMRTEEIRCNQVTDETRLYQMISNEIEFDLVRSD